MGISQKKGSDTLLFLLGILLISFPCTFATVYKVGGNNAWNINIDYDAWAKKQTFKTGDILEFTFDSTRHDVVEVNRTEYESCTYSRSPVSTSPLSVTLETAREYYFICPVGNHCSSYAMKVAVNVTGSSAPSPALPPQSGAAFAFGPPLVVALLVAPFLCPLAFSF